MAFTPPCTSLDRGEAPNLNLPLAWMKRKKSALKKNQPKGRRNDAHSIAWLICQKQKAA